jgi:hypothetical protein
MGAMFVLKINYDPRMQWLISQRYPAGVPLKKTTPRVRATFGRTAK